MSLTYASASTLNRKIDRMSSLVSYNTVVTPRTAKTLITNNVTSTSAPGTPYVNENALSFSGTSSYISIDSAAASWAATGNNTTDGGTNGKLWFGTQGQFTVEWFVYFNSTTNPFMLEFGAGGPAVGFNSTNVYWAHSQSSYGLQWSFGTPSANTWYHFAFTRQWPSGLNPTYEFFKNGVSLGTQTDSYNYQGTTPTGGLTMPAFGTGLSGSMAYMNAYMQEIRISNINRYTSGNFTPTSTPFVNDSNTLLLIHGTSPIQDDNS